MPVLAAFHRAYPGVVLSLSLGNSSEAVRDLLDGRTDVAAFSDRVEDKRLFAVAAARSRQVVVVARTHRWAGREAIHLAELHGAPMVMREEGSVTRRAFEAAIREADVVPEIVMELGSREAVQEAVAAGLGAGVVIEAERGHDERLVTLKLADIAIEHVDFVACLEERRHVRAISAFLEHVPRLPRRGGHDGAAGGPTGGPK
jgi:LysR family transcriptional regulator, low CO2-responsive transcriptional regulator